MSELEKTVRVELGDRSYDILIGPGLIARAGRSIPRSRSIRASDVACGTESPIASNSSARENTSPGVPSMTSLPRFKAASRVA